MNTLAFTPSEKGPHISSVIEADILKNLKLITSLQNCLFADHDYVSNVMR